MASATRIPSMAAEVMPPAYPAPSPQGYIPATDTDSKLSPRKIRTGDEVPASILQMHPNAIFVCDDEALSVVAEKCPEIISEF